MSIFFFRTIILLLVAVVGSSFVPVIFPFLSGFPFVGIALSITLALSRGFVESLPSVVAAGLLSDVAQGGRIGIFAAFFVASAYASSFLSRRFVLEHGFSALLLSSFLTTVLSCAFPVAASILSQPFGPSIAFPTAWQIVSVMSLSFLSVAFFRFGLGKFDDWTLHLDPRRSFRIR